MNAISWVTWHSWVLGKLMQSSRRVRQVSAAVPAMRCTVRAGALGVSLIPSQNPLQIPLGALPHVQWSTLTPSVTGSKGHIQVGLPIQILSVSCTCLWPLPWLLGACWWLIARKLLCSFGNGAASLYSGANWGSHPSLLPARPSHASCTFICTRSYSCSCRPVPCITIHLSHIPVPAGGARVKYSILASTFGLQQKTLLAI